jgi:hypothetical protein
MHDHGGVTSVTVGARLDRRSALVVALLVAFGSLVSGSFLLHASDLHLPACSEPWDAAIYPWNFFWTKAALPADDGSFLFTRRFYWPSGEGLGLYTPTWIDGVLSLPFQWFGAAPQSRHVAFAFVLWLSSVATALLAYRLARELGVRRGGALLVGALATVASGRTMNAARLNLFTTEFLLLYALAALAVWRHGGLRRGLALGFAATLLFLQSQPLFFQAGLASAGFLVVALARSAATRRQLVERLASLAAGALLFLALSGPFLWEMAQEVPHSPAQRQSEALLLQGSLDVADLVLPNSADRLASAYSSVLPLRAPSFFEEGGPVGTVSHFLGAAWIALALVGLATRGGRRAALFALGALALAIGPLLHWRGALHGPVFELFGVKLTPWPFSWLAHVPLLSLEKSPTRFVWLVQFGLALAAAFGLERIAFHRDGRARRVGALAAGALALLATFEQTETVPIRSTQSIAIPPPIAAMAREPGHFAVLDLPFDRPGDVSHCVNALAMAFGAAHERPIFFGLYPRAAREHEAELEARPLFQLLRRCETAGRDGSAPPTFTEGELAAARRDLAELSIGAVQLHDVAGDPERSPGERARLRALLRQLRPASEQTLRPGNGYSVDLFRF